MKRDRGDAEQPRYYNRLAVFRSDTGMSRKELADALGVHYQTIGYLERGEYTPSLVLGLRIARIFDVPVEAVFSLTPFRPLSEHVSAIGKDS